MGIKLGMLLVFFAVMVGIGLYCRKHATDVSGFVLGGRSVGPWLTAFAYGTSYFSAVVFVGYAGQFGWKYGIAATWAGIGNAILGSLLAWVVLGRRTRIMTQHLDSATMPEFFGKRFGSRSLKVAASVIIFIFLIPYTASLYNGLSRLFGMAFDIDYSVCVVVMAVLTGVYVIAGGYMATANNDFIQGIIMIFGIVAVIAAVLNSQGGFLAALEGLPQMVQKFYAIKSEKAIDTGTVISTLFAVIVAGGCYFLGGFGRLFSGQIDIAANGYDSVIPTMLSGLPDVLLAVVVVLVLSASMSTLSSLVLTSSSTLTLDLLKDHVWKDMDQKRQVFVMRCLIVVFIAISVVLAIIQYRSNVTFIAQLMGVSWGALAGAFLAPFLFGLYWKRATKAACWTSFLFSTVFMLAVISPLKSVLPALLQSPINAGAFCMVAGLVIVPLVSLCTAKPDRALVEDAFSCYDEKVLVRQSQALGDK